MEDLVDLIGRGIDDLSRVNPQLISPWCVALNLHGNCLMSLHGLPRLSQLRELNVSSNELVTCDLPELSQLPSLCSLDLSANRIDSLAALPFLPGLRSLSVAFNNLTSLTGVSTENVPDLEVLDARGNFIAGATQLRSLASLTRLHALALGGRQPNPICDNVPALATVLDACSSLQTLDGLRCQEWRDLHAEERIKQDEEKEEERDENKENSVTSGLSAGHSLDSQVSTPKFDEISRRFKAQILCHRSQAIEMDAPEAAEPFAILSQQGTQTEDEVAPAALEPAPFLDLMTPSKWHAFTAWANQMVSTKEEEGVDAQAPVALEPSPLSQCLPEAEPELFKLGPEAHSLSSRDVAEDKGELLPMNLEQCLGEQEDQGTVDRTCLHLQEHEQLVDELREQREQLHAALAAAASWEKELAEARVQASKERLAADRRAQQERQRADASSKKILASALQAGAARREVIEYARRAEVLQKQLGEMERSHAATVAAEREVRLTQQAVLEENLGSMRQNWEQAEQQAKGLEEALQEAQGTIEMMSAGTLALELQLEHLRSELKAVLEQQQQYQQQYHKEQEQEQAHAARTVAALEAEVHAVTERLEVSEARSQQALEVSEARSQQALETQRAHLEGEFLSELQALLKKRDEHEARLQQDQDAARKALLDQITELALCVSRLQTSLKAANRSNRELRRGQVEGEVVCAKLRADLQTREVKVEAARLEMAELWKLCEDLKRRESAPVVPVPVPSPVPPLVIDLDARKDGQIAELQLRLSVKEAQLTDQRLEISSLKTRLSTQAQANQQALDELMQDRLEAEQDLHDALEEVADLERQADKWRLLAKATQAFQDG